MTEFNFQEKILATIIILAIATIFALTYGCEGPPGPMGPRGSPGTSAGVKHFTFQLLDDYIVGYDWIVKLPYDRNVKQIQVWISKVDVYDQYQMLQDDYYQAWGDFLSITYMEGIRNYYIMVVFNMDNPELD